MSDGRRMAGGGRGWPLQAYFAAVGALMIERVTGSASAPLGFMDGIIPVLSAVLIESAERERIQASRGRLRSRRWTGCSSARRSFKRWWRPLRGRAAGGAR